MTSIYKRLMIRIVMMLGIMTKAQYRRQLIEKTNMTAKHFGPDGAFDVARCDCRLPGCRGWMVVIRQRDELPRAQPLSTRF